MYQTTEEMVIQVADEGHLLIPAEIVVALGLRPHESVTLQKRGDNVVLQPSRRERLERMGELLRLALAGVDPAEIKAGRTDRCF